MGRRSPLFTAAAGFSTGLLPAGAVLAVLRISNIFPGWHSFGPGAEKAYSAVLWSLLTLCVFSVTITLAVGIREAVRFFGPPAAGPGEPEKERGSSFGVYLRSMGIL